MSRFIVRPGEHPQVEQLNSQSEADSLRAKPETWREVKILRPGQVHDVEEWII